MVEVEIVELKLDRGVVRVVEFGVVLGEMVEAEVRPSNRRRGSRGSRDNVEMVEVADESSRQFGDGVVKVC